MTDFNKAVRAREFIADPEREAAAERCVIERIFQPLEGHSEAFVTEGKDGNITLVRLIKAHFAAMQSGQYLLLGNEISPVASLDERSAELNIGKGMVEASA